MKHQLTILYSRRIIVGMMVAVPAALAYYFVFDQPRF
jgi:hypothetical protein